MISGLHSARPRKLPQVGSQPVYVRAENLELDDTRWSLFGNASYAWVLTSLIAEIGWMQGGDPVAGFDASRSAFDPGEGCLVRQRGPPLRPLMGGKRRGC